MTQRPRKILVIFTETDYFLIFWTDIVVGYWCVLPFPMKHHRQESPFSHLFHATQSTNTPFSYIPRLALHHLNLKLCNVRNDNYCLRMATVITETEELLLSYFKVFFYYYFFFLSFLNISYNPL